MRRADRTTAVLAAVLVPLALATAALMVALWPDAGSRPPLLGEEGVEYVTVRVEEAFAETCEGTSEDRLLDGTMPSELACTRVIVQTPGADGEQRVELYAPPQVAASDVPAGTQVVAARYPATDGMPETWVWSDFSRTAPLGLLALGFVGAVVVVARLRGLRALIGLVLAFGVIGGFIVPALLEGKDGLVVGVTGSAAIVFVVLYLAHGVSRRTTTALLGTLGGLALTALLGMLAARTARLTGISTEEGYRLASFLGQEGVTLRGLFLCGVVLAGLGVLNDVTITQASAVWELRAADPTAGMRDLFARGMRIGRDHIASTVYTIAFAYAGAALPVLMFLELYRTPLLQTVGSGEFAEEVARTLVGSIGLVAAIPLTTAIAALVALAAPPSPEPSGHGHGHGHGHVHG